VEAQANRDCVFLASVTEALRCTVNTRKSLGVLSRIGNARRRPHWLGREDSNLRMAESKSAALPLGYAPLRPASPPAHRAVRRRRNIIGGFFPINDCGRQMPIRQTNSTNQFAIPLHSIAHCRVLVVFTILSFKGAVSEISLTAARPSQTIEETCLIRLW
jgi:hypothetical protein